MLKNTLYPILDLELLRTFVAVVEQGELKKAAQQVHRSQAAVSMQLKRLESQLDSHLMERNNQGINLTESGKTLLAYARQLLQLSQQTLAAMNPTQLQEQLRFGIPSDYANTFTREFIPQLTMALPDVQPYINCAPSRALREQLNQGKLDVIIVSGESAQEPHPLLWSEAQRWVAPIQCHPELQDSLPVAILDTDCIIRDQTHALLQQSGHCWHSVFTGSQLENLAVAVESGMAIALLPEQLINPSTMRILESQTFSVTALITMHLIFADHVSEQAQQEVKRCMSRVIEVMQRQPGH
ncbi:MAG: LysR family transcriptional regulator [Marinobacterium sp.]|nr:LysR family transcriptional regulator [Marinobacterium sp.]